MNPRYAATRTQLKALFLGATALATLLLSGCASGGKPTPANLRTQPLSGIQRQAPDRAHGPTVAIALGGGGLRGFAHIGALQALEEAGLCPDIVVAVDIYCQSPGATAVNAPAILGKVMQTQSCLITTQEKAEADVLVEPMVEAPGMSDRASQERAIAVGYRATHAALARWRSGLAQATPSGHRYAATNAP